MLKFIDEILLCFRSCFSRKAAFEWFATIITGLMIRSGSLGITSIIRDLVLNPSLYNCIEHFFHADSWGWDDIFTRWTKTVSRYAPLKHISGRTVLIDDGAKRASDGKYMPCIKKMAQESESASKPAFIHGHFFGAVECWPENLQNLSAFPCPSRSMTGTALSVNGCGMNLSPMWYRCSVTVSALHSISGIPCLS